ncbi:MAG: DUF512 domain-containing protein, partial [Lachnospiraceae bacterium]|nr:DUF512 domain-containing protein [Lachnospiraceae bacterium]
INDDYIEVTVLTKDGPEVLLEIEKDYEEDLGIEFEKGLMDDYRSCTNKCIFCFIDQNPPGMRETIYFKDDDSRLSFLQGNYITLTNMKDAELERIIRYHMAPINVSVHTTDPELRKFMLGNRFAGRINDQLKRLYDGHIAMNGQIVLVKGVNDGENLDKTISDLSKYMPYMESLSVVPKGMTKYREGLYKAEPFEKEDACKVIDLIESWQEKFYKKWDNRFVHASDEWYVIAGRDIPDAESYDGYPQLENGVGMIRLELDEFDEALAGCPGDDKERHVSIASGMHNYPFKKRMAEQIEQKFTNTKVNVYAIRNDFFGERITVSGLLTGQDIIAQLKGKELGERLILPCNLLRSGEQVLLDDLTVQDIEKALGIRIVINEANGADLLKKVLEG